MHKEWGTTQTQIADLNLSHVTYLIIIFCLSIHGHFYWLFIIIDIKHTVGPS